MMVQKRRSRADKVGKYKYMQQLQKRTLRELEHVKKTQRIILAGLREFFHFDKPFIQEISCVDELDREILQCLYEARRTGYSLVK